MKEQGNPQDRMSCLGTIVMLPRLTADAIRKSFEQNIYPASPSDELNTYFATTLQGQNPDIPYVTEQGMSFDYYGKSKQGDELARFIIPWGEKLEKSYHIVRTERGEILVTFEGFFPTDR